jgi:sodium-dependent dicarboxylate transporter 2/3/5
MNDGLAIQENTPSARAAGRVLGPLLAVAVYSLLRARVDGESALTAEGVSVAAIGALMAVLWITEALPLPATSLIPVALFPVLGVAPIREAAAPYAHEFIFLFLGGFMLAQAVEKWDLHKRVALLTLLLVGTRPARLVLGFMTASALLSMWISNTATTVMMLPIAMSVVGWLAAGDGNGVDRKARDEFAACLLLGVAYGATIGGVATIIGTPPNVFLAGFLKDTYGIQLGFGQWMLVGLPLSIVFLPVSWLVLTRLVFPVRIPPGEGGRGLIRLELSALGPMGPPERAVAGVFLCTAAAWIARQPVSNLEWVQRNVPSVMRLHDAGIAVLAALVLFALPAGRGRGSALLDWNSARRLPWGVLLLFGGGLSLAQSVQQSGLASWLSTLFTGLTGQPPFVLVFAVVVSIIFLTELTSNTATAATFLPVLGAVAVGAGVAPVVLVVPAALAASCAFMLPVATPPNAVVFGSDRIRIGHMVRAGLALNVIAIVLIPILAVTLLRWVFGAVE